MGLKVGITTSGGVQDVDAALWSSGVSQNIVFMALLLQRLENVELTALIACPDGAQHHGTAKRFGITAIDQAEAIETLDVIIEMGVRCDGESMRRFRDRGGKLVSYMAGNTMVMNFEAVACNAPHGEFMSDSGFDAVWITPQHWHMNAGYARMTRCDAVEIAPHIWTPMFLQQSAAMSGNSNLFYKDSTSRPPWRIGIFDPNVNVIKTFHLPMMVSDEGFRRRPDLIDRVLMFSANHLAGNIHFEELCGRMAIHKIGKLFAETRYPLAQLLGVHIDAVVTHQWENNLNYLYWDVLYTGWPLIHNSEAIKDVGYYYESFNPQAGGDVLVEALEHHRTNARRNRDQVLEVLWGLHIDNPKVLRRHADLLDMVMQ